MINKGVLFKIYLFWIIIVMITVGIFLSLYDSFLRSSSYFLFEISADKPQNIVQVYYGPRKALRQKDSCRALFMKGTHKVKLLPQTSNIRRTKYIRVDFKCQIPKTTIGINKFLFNDGIHIYEADLSKFQELKTRHLKYNHVSSKTISLTTVGTDPGIIIPVEKMKKIHSKSYFSLEVFFNALFTTGIIWALFLSIVLGVKKLIPVLAEKLNKAWNFQILQMVSFLWTSFTNTAARSGKPGLISSLFSKRTFCIVSIITIGCFAALAVSSFFQKNTNVEIVMESDKEKPLVQLFYSTGTKMYSSSLLLGKKGEFKLFFPVPGSFIEQPHLLRLDPTVIPNNTIRIKKFVVHTRNTRFTLPVEIIPQLQHQGITFQKNESGDGVVGTSLNNDPVIYIPFSKLNEEPIAVTDKLYMDYIMIFCFILTVIPGFCMMKSKVSRKWTLMILGTVSGAALLILLIYKTQHLGKFIAVLLLIYAVKYLYNRLRKVSPEPVKPIRPNFDWSMHYFRAFAISCICIGHTSGGELSSITCYKFFLSDSIYFLFISGYLCQFLFDKKPESAISYYKKKIYNVICPYLFLSLLIIAAINYIPAVVPPDLLRDVKSFSSIMTVLLKGQAVGCYWYIPFVTILFIFTPLLCRMKDTLFLQCLFAAAFISAIFPVRGDWFNLKTSICFYTYFTFSYLFGIAFARYRTVLQPFFKKVCISALILGVALIYFINNNEFPLVMNHMNFLQAIQKYFFTIVVLTLLEYIKNKRYPLLGALADYSFTIFFLHMIFVMDCVKFRQVIVGYSAVLTDAFSEKSWGMYLIFVIYGIGYLLLMLLASFLLKKCIGKYSRYFIGS